MLKALGKIAAFLGKGTGARGFLESLSAEYPLVSWSTWTSALASHIARVDFDKPDVGAIGAPESAQTAMSSFL